MSGKDKCNNSEIVFISAIKAVKRVCKRIVKVEKNPDIANTHKLSTAFRRLLVMDNLVKDFTSEQFLGKTSRSVKNLRKNIGHLRDIQEGKEKFCSLGFNNAFSRSYIRHLDELHADALSSFLSTLKKFDKKTLFAVGKKSKKNFTIKDDVSAKVEKQLTKLMKRVLRHYNNAIVFGNDKELHHMRVDYKYYRYTYEVFSPEVTGAEKDTLKFMKTIQDALGEAHDWYVLKNNITEFREANNIPGGKKVYSTIDKEYKSKTDLAIQHIKKNLPVLEGFNKKFIK